MQATPIRFIARAYKSRLNIFKFGNSLQDSGEALFNPVVIERSA